MTLFRRICIICIGITTTLFLLGVSGLAAAQPAEQADESIRPSDRYPEIKTYAALCRAIYWEHMGDHRRVRAHLLDALNIDKRSSYLNTKMAATLVALKEPGRANIAVRMALRLNPDNADARYLSGILKQRRDPQGAIAEFKIAAELKPDYLELQYRLASILYKDEDYSGASRPLSNMVKLRPYDPELRYRLGYSYFRIGETEKAIKELGAAVKLRRDDLRPHFHLAYLYARQSQSKEAIEECLAVLKRVPDDSSMNLLLAEMYVSVDEFDEAITGLTKFIPKLQRSMRRRGAERALLAEAHYRIATAYKGKGDSRADSHFQKSIDVYKEILKGRGNTGIHYDIAMVYDARGELSLAEQHLRKHIELEPDEPNAYNFLGYMFVENGANLEEAVDLIKKAVVEEPKNGAFHDSLGWAYLKLGDLDKAIEELEKAVQFTPDDSAIREHLGEAYLEKGGEFTEKAVLEWEKALEIKPKNYSLQQRLEELCRSQEVKESESKEN